MRSWKKLSPFEGTKSKFRFETIKSTQRIILAPKIIHSAVVNGDKEIPVIIFYRHFTSSSILPLIHWCHKSPNVQRHEDTQKRKNKVLLCLFENCFSCATDGEWFFLLWAAGHSESSWHSRSNSDSSTEPCQKYYHSDRSRLF